MIGGGVEVAIGVGIGVGVVVWNSRTLVTVGIFVSSAANFFIAAAKSTDIAGAAAGVGVVSVLKVIVFVTVGVEVLVDSSFFMAAARFTDIAGADVLMVVVCVGAVVLKVNVLVVVGVLTVDLEERLEGKADCAIEDTAPDLKDSVLKVAIYFFSFLSLSKAACSSLSI